MKTIEILKQPYDDEQLEFNKDTGKYQLTLGYVKSILYENDLLPFRNDGITKRRLKETSQRIYSYIITHSNTANRQVISFLLNKTENGRKFLIECLSAQFMSDAEYGTNDIARVPMVNVQAGQVLDRDAIKQNTISIECEEVIDDSINYFGINICCMQPYSPFYFNFVRQYEGV